MIIQQYLRRQLSKTLGLSLSVVSGLYMGLNLLNQLKDLDNGQYHLKLMLWYVLLNLPQQIYQLFPMLLLLACLLSFSLLNSHSEILILQSSGVSLLQLFRFILPIGMMFVVMSVVIGEGIAPAALQLAHVTKTRAISNGQALVVGEGLWLRAAPYMIHIDQVVSPEYWEGVSLYQISTTKQMQAQWFAKTASFTGNHWMLHEVEKTFLNADHAKSVSQTSEILPVTLSPLLIQSQQQDSIQELNLWRLRQIIAYREKNHLVVAQYQFHFWRRLFQPLFCMVMLLLAIPFAVGHQRSLSMARRLLWGVGIGFCFYMSNAFLGSFTLVYDVSPLWIALLPLMIFFCVAVFRIVACKPHKFC